MKERFNVVKLLAAAAALTVAGGASAQSAGQWAVSAGINQITPHTESTPITAPALPNSLADVGGDGQPVLVVNYGLTDNISAEFSIGTPYRHELYGAGAIKGTGQLATVEALPPTAFLQYRFFAPDALFRPYVGVGVTYAYFMNETGSFKLTSITNPGAGTPTTFHVDNKLTGSVQLGATMNFSKKFFLNVAFVKTRLSTDAHYSTGQSQHLKLDPTATMLTVGYKF